MEVTAPLLLSQKLWSTAVSQSKHGHRSRDVLGEGACWFWGAAGQPEVMDELLRNASLELHMCSHATCIKQRSQQEPRSQASSHWSSCESPEPQPESVLFRGACISVSYKRSCKNKKHKHCLSVLEAPEPGASLRDRNRFCV